MTNSKQPKQHKKTPETRTNTQQKKTYIQQKLHTKKWIKQRTTKDKNRVKERHKQNNK